jgi:hypothetical protein
MPEKKILSFEPASGLLPASSPGPLLQGGGPDVAIGDHCLSLHGTARHWTGLVYVMPVKALQEVEKHIADARQLIENQRRLIQELRNRGPDQQDILVAKDLLKALHDRLEALNQQRKLILDQIRQPLATSRPPAESGSSRKRTRRFSG